MILDNSWIRHLFTGKITVKKDENAHLFELKRHRFELERMKCVRKNLSKWCKCKRFETANHNLFQIELHSALNHEETQGAVKLDFRYVNILCRQSVCNRHCRSKVQLLSKQTVHYVWWYQISASRHYLKSFSYGKNIYYFTYCSHIVCRYTY